MVNEADKLVVTKEKEKIKKGKKSKCKTRNKVQLITASTTQFN